MFFTHWFSMWWGQWRREVGARHVYGGQLSKKKWGGATRAQNEWSFEEGFKLVHKGSGTWLGFFWVDWFRCWWGNLNLAWRDGAKCGEIREALNWERGASIFCQNLWCGNNALVPTYIWNVFFFKLINIKKEKENANKLT